MASTSAISPVSSAALAKLKADAGVLARIPADRILDDATSRTVMPYLLVETSGERSLNTMGAASQPKWGSVAGLRVRIVSQYRGLSDIGDTLTAVKTCLDGQPLTVTDYPSVSVDFMTATLLTDPLTGVTTRELIADFDVTVTQS